MLKEINCVKDILFNNNELQNISSTWIEEQLTIYQNLQNDNESLKKQINLINEELECLQDSDIEKKERKLIESLDNIVQEYVNKKKNFKQQTYFLMKLKNNLNQIKAMNSQEILEEEINIIQKNKKLYEEILGMQIEYNFPNPTTSVMIFTFVNVSKTHPKKKNKLSLKISSKSINEFEVVKCKPMIDYSDAMKSLNLTTDFHSFIVTIRKMFQNFKLK